MKAASTSVALSLSQEQGVLDAQLTYVRARLASSSFDTPKTRALLVAVHEVLRRRSAAALAPAGADVGAPLAALPLIPPAWDRVERLEAYRGLVRRVRERVLSAVPPGARTLVVSKGDEELLRVDDRLLAHFPQGASGGYAGHHPADGAAAVEQLDNLARLGADYLVVPATAFWWLEYYAELALYLRGLPAVADDDCAIFDLRPTTQRRATER